MYVALAVLLFFLGGSGGGGGLFLGVGMGDKLGIRDKIWNTSNTQRYVICT
jgi:hypothetical protein